MTISFGCGHGPPRYSRARAKVTFLVNHAGGAALIRLRAARRRPPAPRPQALTEAELGARLLIVGARQRLVRQ
jgi:hypothetical protein